LEAIVEKRKSAAWIWVYLVALALAGTLLGLGIYRAVARGEWDMLSMGLLALVVVVSTWPLAMILGTSTPGGSQPADLSNVNERLEQVSVLLNVISEQQLLSDRAKSVAFREKDRDALRRAIQEELSRQDWDAAMRLADDMEAEFGYRTEADKFREEIRARRGDAVRKQIQEVVTVIDRFTRSEQWNGALREAERLMSMFPENEQVKNLPNEIDQRRQAHKKQLVDNWNDAVARHDIDGSIEILKQLDMYLTPAEAEGLQETARQVFKEKLNQFARQFGEAVHQQRWAEAIRIGDQITREFPNTRMAQEVRDKMEMLKQRASEPAGAAATHTAPAPAAAAAT
jgi:hypothetical protein